MKKAIFFLYGMSNFKLFSLLNLKNLQVWKNPPSASIKLYLSMEISTTSRKVSKTKRDRILAEVISANWLTRILTSDYQFSPTGLFFNSTRFQRDFFFYKSSRDVENVKVFHKKIFTLFSQLFNASYSAEPPKEKRQKRNRDVKL